MNTTNGKLQSSPTGAGLGLTFNLATFTTTRHYLVLSHTLKMTNSQENLLFKEQQAM
jgi:hypothetical protein